MIDKKTLSERDICTKYITPSIKKAGWVPMTQMLEEVSFTDGKVYVRGKLTMRGSRKRADYILYYKPNIPIAIVEAKDNNHSIRAGIQQALDYAQILDIPFVFSSNGDGFIFHDKTQSSGNIETELDNSSSPNPESLWAKYKQYKGIETPSCFKCSTFGDSLIVYEATNKDFIYSTDSSFLFLMDIFNKEGTLLKGTASLTPLIKASRNNNEKENES